MANRSQKEKQLLIAGFVIGVIGLACIIVGVILTATGNAQAATAFWVIGAILIVAGIVLISLGSGGLRVIVGGNPQN